MRCCSQPNQLPTLQVQINGFSEQDQENLYMATQAGKSAGKKGLGKSSQGKPIGGAKWEGTKTAFDGDEEDKGAAVAVPVTVTAAVGAAAAAAANAGTAYALPPAEVKCCSYDCCLAS